MKESHILVTHNEPEYELLDSGEGEKLERFGLPTGGFILSRPDPQALWKKKNPSLWKDVDGYFSREEKGSNWEIKKGTPDRWQIQFGGLKFWIKPTTFKHVGLFPEQAPNWVWARRLIEARSTKNGERPSQETSSSVLRKPPSTQSADRPSSEINILNLFAYTGGATLACAQAGASVVHVDGSKVAVNWARENAALSELEKKPIRWILEDAATFVKREIKRGKRYDAIIMDPPSFGHGPNNELWKIEENFLNLIDDCTQLLTEKPLFFLINGYSAGYSSLAYGNNLLSLKEKFGGEIETGELVLGEAGRGRLLPAGIFARWSNN